jgi:hypothetical protein
MIKFKTYICTSGRSFIFVFEFLDEGDMWSVDGKKPEETGLFEKHNFEVSLCQKKTRKHHVFLNWTIEHSVGYLIQLIENKTK